MTELLFHDNIALIGFMGVGKSTVSHYLRDQYSLDEIETDAMIVESENMAIRDIFEKYGEAYFRDCETRAILKLQENVANLKKGSRIVLLTAKPETILKRVRHSDSRPILNGHMNVEYIGELMEKRRTAYEAAADLMVSTDGKRVEDICEEIVRGMNRLNGQ